MDMHEARWLAITVLVLGCGGDDATQVDESSSSTGEPNPSSSTTIDPTGTGPMPTTAADSSSSSSSGAPESSSSDDSSTGAVATGSARFIVRERTGVGELHDPVIRNYADGVLAEPLVIEPALPAGGGVSAIGVAPAGDFVTYCMRAPPEPDTDCFVRTLAVGSVGAAQAFTGGDLPEPLSTLIPDWTEPPGAYFFRASEPGVADTAIIARVGYDAGVLGVPEALVDPPLGFGLDLNDLAISPDGAWLAYTSGATDVPTNAFVVPTDAVAPAVPIAASDVTDPLLEANNLRFLQGSNALIYAVDTEMVGPEAQAYYLLDLAAPTPPGVRIDDPADEALDVSRLSVAPDDHALVYWVGAPLLGDLMFVALDGLSPQAPMLASTLGASDVLITDIGWSPDSRWAYYTAQHELPDTFDLYLLAAAGDTPSAPIAATALIEGGSIDYIGFDAAAHWLYIVAPLDSIASELFRIDVSGDEPGTPQLVSASFADDFSLSGEVTFSEDGSLLLYTVDHGVPARRELWLVDISGDDPGTPTRVDIPEDGYEVQFGARLSPNNSVVGYGLSLLKPDPDGPRPLRLVDLSAPQTVIELSDNAPSVIFLPD